MNKKILTLTIMLGCAAMVAAFSGLAMAAVSGPCVNCHTMHSSQGATKPAAWETDFATELRGSLLASGCVACHTTTEGNPYDATAACPTPFVYIGGSTYLAGGYFTTSPDPGTNDHGNNSHTITSTETPAGYQSSGDFGDYTGTAAPGLSCAGMNGCHGYQTYTDECKAIAGGHHENDLKDPLGYRMLMVGSDKVIGTEASDYERELNLDTTWTDFEAHNLYSANQTTGASISKLCGKCHSDFHASTVVDGAWVRHPSDNLIPTGWEIQTATNYTATDWRYNPVGTIDAITPANGNMYATCISCHRAHGSEYDDILRFDYTNQNADSAVSTGCLGCHNKQRSS